MNTPNVDLTQREFRLLAHTVGWESRSPLYRNHFCAGEGHDDWTTLQALCERSLMVRSVPNALSGGDFIFAVTDLGIALLRGYFDPANILPQSETEE